MAPLPKFDITPEKRAGFLAVLKRQLLVTPTPTLASEVNLDGKTAIVTGSNIGLGLECCRQLLDLGLSRLILAVRSESKGQEARKDLLSGRTASKHDIEVWNLDLSSYKSIMAFTERTKTLDKMDIFVHNAGVASSKYQANKDTGHEENVQVNYLSLFLLTILMLPVLKEKNSTGTPGRLVLVSSDTSAWAAFEERKSRPILAALDDPKNYKTQERYYTSKLLGQLFLTKLAAQVPPSVAVVNCVNPGLCYGTGLNTDLNGSMTGSIWALIKRVIGRSAKLGGRTLTDAAVKHGIESHGQYLEDCKLQPMAPLIYTTEGDELMDILWKETMDELNFAGVDDIVKELSK